MQIDPPPAWAAADALVVACRRSLAPCGGPLAAASTPLRGTPLGWAWEQGVQIQTDPPPTGADAEALVVVCRLRTERSDGTLLTYEFGNDEQRPAADVLD